MQVDGWYHRRRGEGGPDGGGPDVPPTPTSTTSCGSLGAHCGGARTTTSRGLLRVEGSTAFAEGAITTTTIEIGRGNARRIATIGKSTCWRRSV